MTRHDRDAILASVDLDALADHLLGDHRHTRTRTWPCPNPDHAQTGRTPPLATYRNRRNHQRWHCHGCGADGTAIDLLILTGNHTVRSALDWLATHRHLAPTPSRSPAPPTAEPQPTAAIDDYVRACQTQLHRPSGAEALHWLTNIRGLHPDVIDANRLGYDPGPHTLHRPAGIPRVPGIVLPVLDQHGGAVFTQTRVLDDHARCRYLNTARIAAPNPQVAVVRTPHPRAGTVLVCEGLIDALTAATAGLHAVAVLSATTPPHRITRHLPTTDQILIAYDADPAGDHAAQRLLTTLSVTHPDARRLRPPPAHGDLNAWHTHQPDWTHHITTHTRSHTRAVPAPARVLER